MTSRPNPPTRRREKVLTEMIVALLRRLDKLAVGDGRTAAIVRRAQAALLDLIIHFKRQGRTL